MTGYLGKTTNDRRDVVGAQVQTERETIWGPIPGEVKSYDSSTGTARIKPLYRPRHNGEPVDMPELLEVPVEFPRTASGAITFPVKPGTKVMLNPTMRSMENWDTDENGEASDARSFNLSDMRATLIGGDSLKDPLKGVDPDNTHFRFDPEGKFGIRGSEDGKIKIEGSEGNVYELISEAVDLCRDGFDKLSTESTLTHTSTYGSIAAQLQAIVTKLEAMAL